MPKPETPAASASTIPSMQAASNLQLAAVPRGAAGLGRLALRLPGAVKTGSASASQTTTPSGTVAQPSTASQAAAFDPVSLGFSSVPNKDLRIGGV